MTYALAIYEGGRVIASFTPKTDPLYVITVAYRLQYGLEPYGEDAIMAEFLTQRAIHAVAIGRLEVRKENA